MIPAALRGIDHVAQAFGLFRRPLTSSDVVEQARLATELSDFGDVRFEEPLARLLLSLEEEANLTVMGRVAARWDAVRLLSNLLRLRDAEKRAPSVLDQAVVQPIFISGMPRSASTFLHRLLAADPANRVIESWETIHPLPDGRGGSLAAQRAVDRQFAMFAKIAPEFPRVHPITATSPQECTEVTAHIFRSLRFDTTHRVPSYRQWLDDTGHRMAYSFHRRFLKHLQFRKGPGRWILKSPDHIFALDAILDAYPDARFVFTHRDPAEILPSVARLTEVLRAPFTRRVDRAAIGRQVIERWEQGAAAMIAAAESARIPPDRVFHLRYAEFVRDPAGAIAALYRHFGLDLPHATRDRIVSLISASPDGDYGRDKALAARYGLERDETRRRFHDYAAYFGV